MRKKVLFSYEDYLLLKAAYNKAVKQQDKLFIFQEDTWLTAYCKYMLEYLEEKFKDHEHKQ